jgi:hypothetical protein
MFVTPTNLPIRPTGRAALSVLATIKTERIFVQRDSYAEHKETRVVGVLAVGISYRY